MSDNEYICPICGEPTNKYFGNYRKDRLCYKHGMMANAGEIVQCPDCGEWHSSDEDCECEEEYSLSESEENFIRLNEGHEFCVTCGNPTPYGKLQCRDCYYETCDYMNSLNKNSLMNEFRDYYFNLKDAIFRMKDFDTVKSNCNKLIAIAYQNAESNDDSSLINRIEKDVNNLIETKRPKVEPIVTPTSVIEKDEQRENIYSAIDGHRVKSQMECIIDNALWNAGILHAYEQPVIELDFIRKKCDWLIPITGPTKGIYIEYWGMNTEKYLKDRKEKEELYKQNNIPYVGIEKDDPKDSTFIYTLIQDLKRKAKEYFGFMPEWKK